MNERKIAKRIIICLLGIALLIRVTVLNPNFYKLMAEIYMQNKYGERFQAVSMSPTGGWGIKVELKAMDKPGTYVTVEYTSFDGEKNKIYDSYVSLLLKPKVEKRFYSVASKYFDNLAVECDPSSIVLRDYFNKDMDLDVYLDNAIYNLYVYTDEDIVSKEGIIVDFLKDCYDNKLVSGNVQIVQLTKEDYINIGKLRKDFKEEENNICRYMCDSYLDKQEYEFIEGEKSNESN